MAQPDCTDGRTGFEQGRASWPCLLSALLSAPCRCSCGGQGILAATLSPRFLRGTRAAGVTLRQ